ncbi:MAG: hypothetical protein Q8S21_06275 [Candidatus Paracaedibacteraceae bacterium]|nr:hypothetical protein [Candidatus Paracaedibacteraceae bacterium]
MISLCLSVFSANDNQWQFLDNINVAPTGEKAILAECENIDDHSMFINELTILDQSKNTDEDFVIIATALPLTDANVITVNSDESNTPNFYNFYLFDFFHDCYENINTHDCCENIGSHALNTVRLAKSCYSSAPVSVGCSTCCILMPFYVFFQMTANVSSVCACPLCVIVCPITCIVGTCGIDRCTELWKNLCKKRSY